VLQQLFGLSIVVMKRIDSPGIKSISYLICAVAFSNDEGVVVAFERILLIYAEH